MGMIIGLKVYIYARSSIFPDRFSGNITPLLYHLIGCRFFDESFEFLAFEDFGFALALVWLLGAFSSSAPLLGGFPDSRSTWWGFLRRDTGRVFAFCTTQRFNAQVIQMVARYA